MLKKAKSSLLRAMSLLSGLRMATALSAIALWGHQASSHLVSLVWGQDKVGLIQVRGNRELSYIIDIRIIIRDIDNAVVTNITGF